MKETSVPTLSDLSKAAVKKRPPKKRTPARYNTKNPEHFPMQASNKNPRVTNVENSQVIQATQSKVLIGSTMSKPAVDDAVRMVLRKRRWNALLCERPAAFRGLDAWLSQVVSVSDISRPFDLNTSSLAVGAIRTNIPADQLSRWTLLLDERPSSDDSGAVTSWLTSVLSVSCPLQSDRMPVATGVFCGTGNEQVPEAASAILRGISSIRDLPSIGVQDGSASRSPKKMRHTIVER